jgi:hypothetical protein
MHYFRYARYILVDTFVDRQLVPKGIMRTVVSALALVWLIKYIYILNLQFLNNVIIIETEFNLPRVFVTQDEFDYTVQTFWFSSHQRH